MNDAVKNILRYLPLNIKRVIEFLPENILSDIQEIRLRSNLPLAVTIGGRTIFLLKNGQTSTENNGAYICTKSETDETFMLLKNQSGEAHLDEIKEGFIRMENGCRAGICGTFSEKGMIYDVSGINLRIARQFIGCANKITDGYLSGGILILGPPGSGKTTLLRDTVRTLSKSGKRVALIDQRGEISASCYGVSPYDLGENTDTYIIADKPLGIRMALRTMFPQIIAFDEIGSYEELKSVSDSFNAGAQIVTTAHIGKIGDIKRRKTVKELIASGGIKNIFLLSENIGENPQKIDLEVLKNDYDF
ncbi:MAG: Flp pilus assembly complex ATPase component TadA [Clostridia bacterium]|nr:Flp pilus assembly complex ATPase component TadA [Clostridia bacterium]